MPAAAHAAAGVEAAVEDLDLPGLGVEVIEDHALHVALHAPLLVVDAAAGLGPGELVEHLAAVLEDALAPRQGHQLPEAGGVVQVLGAGAALAVDPGDLVGIVQAAQAHGDQRHEPGGVLGGGQLHLERL